jgi:septum formation protein
MLQRPKPRLILASGSVSRRMVLEAAGLQVAIRPSNVDEATIKRRALADAEGAETAALRLADSKARAVALDEPDALVIGADQILVCDGVWFDKPADLAAAREQLRTLRGRAHVLVTAIVCHEGEQRVWQHVAMPRLVMRDFSDAFLDEYLALEGDAVTSTVGSYRLEGLGAHLFASIEGEHAVILGLPLLGLLAFLRQRGLLVG